MDIPSYLQRIQDTGDVSPRFETLKRLHQAHMHTVPFENLDIPLGRKIELSLPKLYHKVVIEHRGGFCYELNSLFFWLLQELGFEVSLLSGRVFSGGVLGLAFDHMLILAELSGKRFLADVGFGDSFREPLIFDDREQPQLSGTYQVLPGYDGFVIYQSRKGKTEPQYTFSLQPFQISDFEPMCHYQQTSEQSVFTQKSVCTLATLEGRVTLSNGRLIETKIQQDSKTEEVIKTEAEYRLLLKERFKIVLPNDLSLASLLAA